jgi:hypothetical protein
MFKINNMTAVEWLYNNLLLNPISNEDIAYNEAVFENAKVIDAQQQGYSEEEVIEFGKFLTEFNNLDNEIECAIKKLLEQFKNK